MPETNATPKAPQVESAPPAAPLSQEEKQRRYAEYRKKTGGSRFAVRGLPGVHYFWGPKDDSSELTRLDIEGYSIVREPKVTDVMAGKCEATVHAGGLRQDGTYVIGDVILMACPQETYEFALMAVTDRHDDLLRSSKENFLNEAEKAGAPTFEFSK